jgi:hypothetical protein
MRPADTLKPTKKNSDTQKRYEEIPNPTQAQIGRGV